MNIYSHALHHNGPVNSGFYIQWWSLKIIMEGSAGGMVVKVLNFHITNHSSSPGSNSLPSRSLFLSLLAVVL